MTNEVLQKLGERFWPLGVEQFFAPQRAAPNPETGDGGCWFGDELPPTMQDFLNSPKVVQAKAYQQYGILQSIAQHAQQELQRQMSMATPKQRKKMAAEYRSIMQAESNDSTAKSGAPQ